jgi:hypothetical protein
MRTVVNRFNNEKQQRQSREGMSSGLDVEPEVAFREGQQQKLNMKRYSLRLLATGLCAVGLFMGMSNVTQAAIAFNPTLTAFGSEPNGNDGLFFTVNATISVTSLGYVDPGTVAGNAVGLYDVTTSTLLGSATVTSLDPLTSSFHYSSITPITLTPGDTYAVVGYYGDSTAVGYDAPNAGAAPQINYLYYAYDHNGSLDIPTTTDFPTPIFGANFQFSVVPEPTTMVAGAGALGLALLGIGRARRSSVVRIG